MMTFIVNHVIRGCGGGECSTGPLMAVMNILLVQFRGHKRFREALSRNGSNLDDK